MLTTKKVGQAKNFRLSVRVTAGILILVAVMGFFEAMARVVYAFNEEIRENPVLSSILQRSLILDPYEMPSANGQYHWVLRPGYKANPKELISQKKRAGRDHGASILQADNTTQVDDNIFEFGINADGFKGPDLDKNHAYPRILALGDSTTFGHGHFDYPRRLESGLKERGISIEVVNGGVEGYSPRNTLYEIERYKALKPEFVTLYIGWNSLFSNVPWNDSLENRLRAVWLFRHARRTLRALMGDQKAYAVKMYNRVLKPDPNTDKVKALETYKPPDMVRIERIIDEFESIGTRVILVTLPGLFTMRDTPSSRSLKIGHLPYFTENPYVLAKLAERYNAALRTLAERRGLDIIDLEKWSHQALQPRDAFFSDSVHLTAKGLEMIGTFMADQFESRLLLTP